MKAQYFYSVFEESRSSPELGAYVTYGVKAAPEDDHSACFDTVADVSLSEARLGVFVRLCNELQLSPIHLRDVIEDFLAQ